MAKKHKHEEHVNHERWLVSFADMMTLLFALFVVLYALGTTELEKLRKLKKSVQFAFHIAGDGKTKDVGIFDRQQGGGDVPESAPLLNAQSGEMKEFLQETLPEFQEVTGKSLDIVQTDDSISFAAPLSKYFDREATQPVKPEVYNWLGRAIEGSLSFTSDVRIVIESPELSIRELKNGRHLKASDINIARLLTMRRSFVSRPEIRAHTVGIEYREMKEQASAKNWEDQATLKIVLSNKTGR